MSTATMDDLFADTPEPGGRGAPVRRTCPLCGLWAPLVGPVCAPCGEGDVHAKVTAKLVEVEARALQWITQFSDAYDASDPATQRRYLTWSLAEAQARLGRVHPALGAATLAEARQLVEDAYHYGDGLSALLLVRRRQVAALEVLHRDADRLRVLGGQL